MSANPQTCQSCRFWQHDPKCRPSEYPRPVGICRKNAPGSSMEPWPITTTRDWCGAYEEGRPPRVYLGTVVSRNKHGYEETDILGPFILEEDATDAVRHELTQLWADAIVACPATSTDEQEWHRVTHREGLPAHLVKLPMDDDEEPVSWDAIGEVFSREVR